MQLLTSLNEKQRDAVLSEDKRLLVLAGAGSGKTKTLIQKILHLISESNVKSTQILAITFTKNAANEMVDRLIMSDDEGSYKGFIESKDVNRKEKDFERFRQAKSKPWIDNLTVKTFHSLCYQILKRSGGSVFDNQFRLITDEQVDEEFTGSKNIAPEKPFEVIHKILIEKCNNTEYLLKLKRYILDFYVDRSFIDKEVKQLSYPESIRYTTLRGEKVRSKSERDIADWLFRHNIDYAYEPQVNFRDFNFKPDFFIPQADIYLEHISDKSYKTEAKEQQFKISNKTCVKTFESMTHNTSLFNLALERIILGKIKDSITKQVALKFEEEFKSYHDKIKEFLKMVMRVMSLVKGENITLRGIWDKSKGHQHERVRVFYELALPLIRDYKNYCVNKSYLDFDDLIIETIRLLKEHKEIRELYQEKFSYVLVDEFQDVNHLQVKLLDLLLTDKTQLFCVGDDWQSIYGFRGSEVDYIINFENYFKDSRVIKLDTNYRSTQMIVGASNEVIKNNKFRVDKEIKAVKHTPNKIQVYKARKLEQDGVEYLVQKVSELIEQGINGEDILVLYRRSRMFEPFRKALKEEGLKISAKTIHASKGLESKVVFIIGLTDGSGGFPDIWLDDVIFRVIKDVKYDMLMEEERRLFYVAITRAKEELFLLTQLGSESRFINEIPSTFCSFNNIEFKNTETSITCSNCGHELIESYRFCPHCGQPTQQF